MVLNAYADLLEGHTNTAVSRVAFHLVSFGVSSKIKSWEKVVGKTSATIMKAGSKGYDKAFEKAVEDYDRKTYPRELKPEDY